MSVLFLRNVLPVVTSLAAAVFLATAVPLDLESAAGAAPSMLASAELGRCVDDGRDQDACLDEVEGKALIERAEWQARTDDATRRVSR